MRAMGTGATGREDVKDMASEATPSASRERRAELEASIREMGEERDLGGLAAVAEASLRALRQLVERPVTCSELDEMLERLERLNLDDWEMEA